MNKLLEYVNSKIADLEDDLQHYTMVEKDKCREFFIREDLKQFINIKQALQRLEIIDNIRPSEALECLKKLDDMEFHRGINTYVPEIDSEISETQYLNNTDEFYIIKQALIRAQENEKLKVDICEMFGLDNLFPYNDTKAILKELEGYMDRKNQLWIDFMKTSKKLEEQENKIKS